jgi:hypothetical protein
MTTPTPLATPSARDLYADGGMMSQDIQHEIILRQSSVASILRALYEYHKLRSPRMSLAYICRRSGISSKGYLALVMAGKRRLNEKYWAGLTHTFKLSSSHCDLLFRRLREETLRDQAGQKRPSLQSSAP